MNDIVDLFKNHVSYKQVSIIHLIVYISNFQLALGHGPLAKTQVELGTPYIFFEPKNIGKKNVKVSFIISFNFIQLVQRIWKHDFCILINVPTYYGYKHRYLRIIA